MMPTLTNRLGTGCTTTDPNPAPEVTEYPNCCKLRCCSLHVNGMQLLVRAAEREVGVEEGAREGLDFEAKQFEEPIAHDSESEDEEGAGKGANLEAQLLKKMNKIDVLRDRQMWAFAELQKHAECRKVLKPGRKNFQGIMTRKREILGVGPWEDDDTKQQKWKLFQLFRPENEMRIHRAKNHAEQSELYEKPKFDSKEHEDLYKLYEQQTEELMEYLAYQEEKFQTRVPPPLEPAIKTRQRFQLRDTSNKELMMFKMEIDDAMD